tara:strand:+ start:49 stop:825 length:777 start_codon:yes stop_codon:yes gene_type:complete
MDFTLNTYKRLLETIKETQHETCSVQQYISDQIDKRSKLIILRHDVDRRPVNALKMAKIEASLGFQSTYYFRHMRNTFKPQIIQEIAAMGHEIGYHYETLAKARGQYDKAYQLFQNELSDFRKIAEVNTICMHGRPLSPWDNRDLWNRFDYTSHGIIGEPYLSIDYSNIIYLTDTGRSWDGGKYNLRDKVDTQIESRPCFVKTEDISSYLPNNTKTIMLQTHPERWAHSAGSLIISLGSDQMTNAVKRLLITIRSKAS